MALSLSLAGSGCFEREEGETFYGKVIVPRAQEFRWSDGGLPRVFDPARAAAPPDTDAVRALFEGLTEYAPGTVRPAPAVASRWESADGGRTWVFHLRRDARWSNGDPVTARDFVRSWQRTIRMGERAPHAKLLANVRGALPQPTPQDAAARAGAAAAAPIATPAPGAGGNRDAKPPAPPSRPPDFGAVALDSHTLRVTLERPDRNFPALVAHPVFRPVHELSPNADLPALQDEQMNRGGGEEFGVVTNGAFSLARLGGDSVVLERAANYWDVTSVKLERVYFVNQPDPEAAINAYRAGEVDAVTNAAVEPLAVKLLTPYRDFRRETFAALNYYRFNTSRPPFDDRRVRAALALALDLERLSHDTLGGATEPAAKFLPFEIEALAAAAPAEKPPRTDEAESPDGSGGERGDGADAESGGADGSEPAEAERAEPLRQNVERARRLLAEAGYPDGENFPRVRLLVNRNEQQRLIANAVARMWRTALGVETEIILRGWEEYEMMLRAGDFDVARRSLVMQTTDEATNMLALFGEEPRPAETPAPASSPAADDDAPPTGATPEPAATAQATPILTEARALGELPAIPIYFASSYALVKPYVKGFESNLLDAPSLKHVHIDTAWRDPRQKPESTAAHVPR
ncbi:MAG TPA: peptide ABC transporter substrate-binding protein [Pyrinomonadaceae bacterium]|nr:peptide ABC transporter substrate-binding protein [Pyrinomonadaceae bacterium]